MLNFILNKIVGTQNERQLRRLKPRVDEVNGFEPIISKLSDEALRAKTDEFKKKIGERLAEFGQEKEILDEILPQAFAVVREAAKRTIGMRHFDVQIMGGIVLHEGRIAEMATGEGKTLVATLSLYLNALTGKGAHLITVNDYLAKRDRYWMGPVYEFLGLTVGVIQHGIEQQERQMAYACDITYGTNNEFGFDYLRDNMVLRKEDMAQRGLNYAIVDEVDSILVDEARTPLIISGPAEESTQLYYNIDKLFPHLIRGQRDELTKKETGDYIVDEKAHTVYLTEEGEIKAAKLLDLEDLHSIEAMEYKHHINQMLRAHELFEVDTDYVIKDNQVVIVDEFTGRMMPGRRWSDGLHQAIEAKEAVRIERENQTLATITFQNYFRMYKKLAGMTGTAATEAQEFIKIYGLDVVVIPTNCPLIRTNYPDAVYKTEKGKFKAIVDEISELYSKSRPILVGTISIDRSERLSQLLHKRNILHNVLNAKYHENEAYIVAQAGRFGAVTIATNMAGRGTDILLGGNAQFMADEVFRAKGIDPKDADLKERKALIEEFKKKVDEEHKKVVELGGLHVLGTERHEARRIDNQLRGRSGRQGDPGSSKFYLSLEDDLLRIFGSDRVAVIMNKLGVEEGQVIEHPLVTKSIEIAQKRVETHNFEIRKQLLEYDNVMNRQREVIYQQRREILEKDELKSYLMELIDDMLDLYIDSYIKADTQELDLNGLCEFLRAKFGSAVGFEPSNFGKTDPDQIKALVLDRIKHIYQEKERIITSQALRNIEKAVMLHIIDIQWKDHLYNMDLLREGIGLRAYGQHDPLVEYQHEGYQMFCDMIQRIKEEIIEFMFRVEAPTETLVSVFEPTEFLHPEAISIRELPGEREIQRPTPYKRDMVKVGRNDPCPCGSGKKYKKCCGR